MAKEKPPAFQWYPKDYLSDAKVKRMTFTERGIYVHAMNVCWLENGLPVEVSEIGRSLEVQDLEWFAEQWKNVAPCFKVHPKDKTKLIHPRLEKEKRNQKKNRKIWRENGTKGGRPNVSNNLGETKIKAVGCSGETKKKPLLPPSSPPSPAPSSPSASSGGSAKPKEQKKKRPALIGNANLARLMVERHVGDCLYEKDTSPGTERFYNAIMNECPNIGIREVPLAYILTSKDKDNPQEYLIALFSRANYSPPNINMMRAKMVIQKWESRNVSE